MASATAIPFAQLPPQYQPPASCSDPLLWAHENLPYTVFVLLGFHQIPPNSWLTKEARNNWYQSHRSPAVEVRSACSAISPIRSTTNIGYGTAADFGNNSLAATNAMAVSIVTLPPQMAAEVAARVEAEPVAEVPEATDPNVVEARDKGVVPIVRSQPPVAEVAADPEAVEPAGEIVDPESEALSSDAANFDDPVAKPEVEVEQASTAGEVGACAGMVIRPEPGRALRNMCKGIALHGPKPEASANYITKSIRPNRSVKMFAEGMNSRSGACQVFVGMLLKPSCVRYGAWVSVGRIESGAQRHLLRQLLEPRFDGRPPPEPPPKQLSQRYDLEVFDEIRGAVVLDQSSATTNQHKSVPYMLSFLILQIRHCIWESRACSKYFGNGADFPPGYRTVHVDWKCLNRCYVWESLGKHVRTCVWGDKHCMSSSGNVGSIFCNKVKVANAVEPAGQQSLEIAAAEIAEFVASKQVVALANGYLFLAAKLSNAQLPLEGEYVWWHKIDDAPEVEELCNVRKICKHKVLYWRSCRGIHFSARESNILVRCSLELYGIDDHWQGDNSEVDIGEATGNESKGLSEDFTWNNVLGIKFWSGVIGFHFPQAGSKPSIMARAVLTMYFAGMTSSGSIAQIAEFIAASDAAERCSEQKKEVHVVNQGRELHCNSFLRASNSLIQCVRSITAGELLAAGYQKNDQSISAEYPTKNQKVYEYWLHVIIDYVGKALGGLLVVHGYWKETVQDIY